eukprot:78497-Chlamydomonas_euryale.AAC.1
MEVAAKWMQGWLGGGGWTHIWTNGWMDGQGQEGLPAQATALLAGGPLLRCNGWAASRAGSAARSHRVIAALRVIVEAGGGAAGGGSGDGR